MHAAIFYRNMHIATFNMRAVSILRCNIDSFLLKKKGLESMSILHKKFCNMHIARRNMHIAIESILPLTHTDNSKTLFFQTLGSINTITQNPQ
jgi:hypothetical protein